MVRLSEKSTLKTEEKILATVERMKPDLKASLQEKLLNELPDGCTEAENWIRTLKGATAELSNESTRWNRTELKTLGTLANYCDRWLSVALS